MELTPSCAARSSMTRRAPGAKSPRTIAACSRSYVASFLLRTLTVNGFIALPAIRLGVRRVIDRGGRYIVYNRPVKANDPIVERRQGEDMVGSRADRDRSAGVCYHLVACHCERKHRRGGWRNGGSASS